MSERYLARSIELVLKISKYCNLRCSYCYEYSDLGDRTLMPLGSIEKLLRNVSSFRPNGASSPGDDVLSFIWHGGEPFLVPLRYFDEVGSLQRDILNGDTTYKNCVQTNLTILTDEHLRSLKERRFFRELGFSFDVYGDQRIDVNGRSSTERVLRNLQTLIENGIRPGAIVVLSRSTMPYVTQIFKFYEALGLDYRLLPYNIERFSAQTETNGLTADEIATGLCQTFDLWLQSERPIMIEPLDAYLNSAINFLNGQRNDFFDKWSDESIFVLNVDGAVHGYESYLGEESYGNLIHQTFEEILESPVRRRLADKASGRVDEFCSACRFYGACAGVPVAEALPLEEVALRERGCHVADVIAHIVARLEADGIHAVSRRTENSARRAQDELVLR